MGISEIDSLQAQENIFIVGMPRSGSTLVESIISINKDVIALGEVNFLEDSLFEWSKIKNNIPKITVAELYRNKIKSFMNGKFIATNKWLYNYEYIDFIISQIPKSKIVHCFRNPLDNILSIYRAHFAKGNEYSSSLTDCARVYLKQEETIRKFKDRYRSYIFDLNYDKLVSEPTHEIKSLISWVGWEWDSAYLYPHLNPRSISTASSVKVRSPINSKSIQAWKNYKDLLMPAINILESSEQYKNIRFI